MTILHKLFMYKLAGSFNFLITLIVLFSSVSHAEQKKNILFTTPKVSLMQTDWSYYDRLSKQAAEQDQINGLSYVISGGLALLGGLAGANVTSDPLEKGVYALFQTIGIASIGYGAYKWKVGDEERLLMTSLRNTPSLNDNQRLAFLNVYYEEKKDLKEKERYIKAITHGLIAALNFYNASQQSQDGVKNTLYFIGGANLLAAFSYSF